MTAIMPIEYYENKIQLALKHQTHYRAGSQAYHDRLAYIGLLLLGAFDDGYKLGLTGNREHPQRYCPVCDSIAEVIRYKDKYVFSVCKCPDNAGRAKPPPEAYGQPPNINPP